METTMIEPTIDIEDEQRKIILELFRKLSPELQAKVLEFIDFMIWRDSKKEE